MSSFYQADLYKLLKIPVFRWLIFFPIVVDLACIFIKIDEHKEVLFKNMEYARIDNLHYYISLSTFIVFATLMPFFLTVFTISFAYIERQSNSILYNSSSKNIFSKYLLSKYFSSFLYMIVWLTVVFLVHLVLVQIFSSLRSDLQVVISLDVIFFEARNFFLLFVSSVCIIPLVWLIVLLSDSYITISFSLVIIGLLIPIRFQPFQLSFSLISTVLDPQNIKHSLRGLEKVLSYPFWPILFSCVYGLVFYYCSHLYRALIVKRLD
jgi:hypothetical protein